MNKKDSPIIINLIEKGIASTSISQLSKDIEIDYKTVYEIVKRLEKEDIITLEKFGKAYNVILNKKNHPIIFEAEYKRRETLLKNPDFKILYHKLNNLPFPFIGLIFGSQAKNDAHPRSDIDLLIICEQNRENEFESLISLLPLNIDLNIFNFEEFISMIKNKEFTVVSEAINNNIILVGIEEYYRMLEHAK